MDHQEWLEQHDRMIADHEMRHDRDMAELRASHVKLEASQDKTERTLRRAIRLSVLDARRQRARNADFDVIMAQIAAAQLANEELLKRFLERGGNGRH
jgi:hypothetical protein